MILDDSSAVVTERGRYVLRWRDHESNYAYPQLSGMHERRRTHHNVDTPGPVYQWPDVDSLWDEIDDQLGAIAAELADQMLEAGGNAGVTTDDEDGTGLKLQEAIGACPELATAIQATVAENRDPPDSICDRIRYDLTDIARGVMDKLSTEQQENLEQRAAATMAAHELAQREGG